MGEQGVLIPLIKQLIELSLDGEMEHHLAHGKASKILQTAHGPIELETPRDRDAEETADNFK